MNKNKQMNIYFLFGKCAENLSGLPSLFRRFSTTEKVSRTAGIKLSVTECRDLIL
jgi:hypothetical protein